MADFVIDNIGTIAVLGVLMIIVGLIVFFAVKNKKNGMSSCSGGCVGCPFSGKCKK